MGNLITSKLLGGLLLWFVFSLGVIYAIPRLLLAVLKRDESVWKPLGYAMDRVLAALFGFSGQYTLSACLATGTRLQWLRKVVDWLEAGHCEKAAKAENLIK